MLTQKACELQIEIGVYTCDFTNASFPVALSSFSSPNPQRLKITFFNGNLVSSSVFSGFNAYDVSTFDTNYRLLLKSRAPPPEHLVSPQPLSPT